MGNLGSLGFVSPVKSSKPSDGYFLRSCAKANSASLGVLSGHDIRCIDPGGVHKKLFSDVIPIPGALRAMQPPLGVRI